MQRPTARSVAKHSDSGFAAVLEHRQTDLERAERNLAEAHAARLTAAADAERHTKALAGAERSLTQLREQIERFTVEIAKREAAQDRVRQCDDALKDAGGSPVPNELPQLEERLAQEKLQERKRTVLVTKLEQLPRVKLQIQAEQLALDTAEAARTGLRRELDELNFDTRQFAVLETQRQDAAESLAEAVKGRDRAAAAHARAEQEVATVVALAAQAQQQHGQASALAEEVRYVGRSAELLHGFRQQVVAAIGPRLQVQASELFNLLTAGEYDGIELDPETYEISIIDAGVPYLSSRFSGSEVDLANLALRVAISEQVRFQAGGQVGLLVLDEALASLDTDRKDRMLAALTQLSGRFRQILVVTHAPEVKERLPRAVEIIKLPGRRATARVVDVGGGA